MVTSEKLKNALWRTSPGKALGLDLITVTIARKAWKRIEARYTVLVNDCIRLRTFTACWKAAEVVTILKAPDNDPMLPK